MQSKQKLFAFKLAAKDNQTQTKEKWVAREGVAAAGCTDYKFPGNVRYPHSTFGVDRGIYC